MLHGRRGLPQCLRGDVARNCVKRLCGDVRSCRVCAARRLSNIYLDRLDKFAETVLIPEYTRGIIRVTNPEYARLTRAISDAWRRGDRAAARRLRTQRGGCARSGAGSRAGTPMIPATGG
jgi:hypothetical protein